jgi:hypothetical protein
MTSKNILKDYLCKNDLTENLELAKILSFHWANWDETCMAQRKNFQNYNKNNQRLAQLNSSLIELKSKPVWLCNKVKVLKKDMYSLYESYLDSRLRLTWFERKEEILFSTDGEQGPYYSLTTMKWLDKKIYSQFVLRKILLDYFTLRSFRLNTSLPIVMKFNNDVNFYHDKVDIHQISETGLILKFKDKNFVNKIKNSSKIDFRIPVQTFSNISNLSFEESMKVLNSKLFVPNDEYKTYVIDSKIINYYGNATNSKRTGEDEFYIFARYEDLSPVKHENDLINAFKTLVDKTKKRFSFELMELRLDEEKKSA